MADFAAARLNMVESQVRIADVTDVRIHDAMRVIPRETFVPAAKQHLAYADIEVEYAPGSWLLKPRDVAKLVQALRPMPGERALEPSVEHAAALIERLMDDRAEARAMGRRAQVHVRDTLSVKAAGRRILARLEAIRR